MPKRSKNYPKRGEIYIADLNPAFGREIHKKRPILIISNNTLNQVSSRVIMLPFSSIVPKVVGPELIKVSKLKGLEKESIILVSHIRAIDEERLLKKIGRISEEKLLEVEDSLKLVLGMIALDS